MPETSKRGVILLLEGLVVLVSILAAFFLEGWRADLALRVSIMVRQQNSETLGSGT